MEGVLEKTAMAKLEKNIDIETKKTTLTKFYESVAPLYAICRSVGIFPLKAINKDNEIEVEANKNDRVYFLSFLMFYILLALYSVYFLIMDGDSFSVVPHMVVLAESMVVVILMYMTMFFCFWFRHSLLECVKLLVDVDSVLPCLNIIIDYVKAKKNNFNVFGIMLTSVTVRSLITIMSVRVDLIQQITLFMATFIKSLSKYEFIAFLLPIMVRFGHINRTIVSYGTKYEEGKLPGNLYTLCRLHFKLCNISRVLNGSFAFQLLSSLGVSLTDILFHAFYLYTISTKKHIHATWAMFASPIVWLLDECLEIYLLVNACSKTCDLANNTAILLHELRNTLKKNEVDAHIQMYSLQMLHQKLEFSALGFFNIDYSLLYSILGAVTTYLVIFIQFDQSQESKEELILATKATTTNCTAGIMNISTASFL